MRLTIFKTGLLTALFTLALFSLALSPAMAQDMDMTKTWPALMTDYLSDVEEDGLVRFDYARLADTDSDEAVLHDYIDGLAALDPDELSDAEATAYWANLYNALTVKVVVDNYPVDSIKEIKSGMFSKGPWKKNLIKVNGEKLSLDDIEHDILRKQFPSPLVHYMVNCASIGCPNLVSGEWTAETLDADRNAAARAFINSPRGAMITDKGLVVSSIYNWFDKDFGGSKKTVLAHIREYADDDLAAAIDDGAKIKGYDYNWSLNGITETE